MLLLGGSNNKNIDVGVWDIFEWKKIVWDKVNIQYPEANRCFSPSITSWAREDEVENKFAPKPLDPNQNQLEPCYTGRLNAMTWAQCCHQRLNIVKKICSNEHRDRFGERDLYFYHWLPQCWNKIYDTIECHKIQSNLSCYYIRHYNDSCSA